MINTFGAQIVHPRPKFYIYIYVYIYFFLSDNKTRERVENWNHQNKYSIKQWHKKKRKETHQTIIWLKPRSHNKECKKKNQKSGVVLYCVVYLCNVWLDQQCLKKTSFWLFVYCYLTLTFEEHRLLEFVVERWVCSERVFMAFGTQGALIFAIISKVVPTGGKTIWYRWFSRGCNQPTAHLFVFLIPSIWFS